MIDNIQEPSTFARMIEKLRYKSEDELKLLYIKFFQNELSEEWKTITQETNFAAEEDIIEAIQKKRYHQ